MSEQDGNDMKPDISENNNSEDVTNQYSTDLDSRETPKKRRSFIEVAEEEKKLPEVNILSINIEFRYTINCLIGIIFR